jgi:6-phosphogluconate dehydrogenase
MKQAGIIGLGRIGGGLAKQAMAKGWTIIGADPQGASPDLLKGPFTLAANATDLAQKLDRPRLILLYVHAGALIDQLLDELLPCLNPGDVVVDGGNSYWGDSVARHERVAAQGIHFVDLGTSGGVQGAETGACFMAGCRPEAWEVLEPLLADVSVPGGWVRAGGPGAGHFVKLVHNGIEFGMMQAIGEGLQLLEKSELKPDISATLEVWRHGSVIRSWLVDLMAEAYRERDGLETTPSHIEDTGEVNWLVQDAVRMEVPIPVIAQSVFQLFASRDSDRAWAKAIALMRLGFGGHGLGPIPALAEERGTMRVGGIREP